MVYQILVNGVCLYLGLILISMIVVSVYDWIVGVMDEWVHNDSNSLLVIAHPDDESMFFIPFIRQQSNMEILCLSNGGYDGLG